MLGLSPRSSAWVGATIGSIIGGMIPLLWGAGEFSFSGLFFGAVGAIVGIYIAWKMS